MSVQSLLKSLILAPGVSAIVGTGVYQRPAPNEARFPLVTFFEVSGRKYRSSETWEKQYQVDCWAEKFPQARTLADEVLKVLEGSSGEDSDVEILGISLRSEQELFDGELHHFALTWDVSLRKK